MVECAYTLNSIHKSGSEAVKNPPLTYIIYTEDGSIAQYKRVVDTQFFTQIFIIRKLRIHGKRRLFYRFEYINVSYRIKFRIKFFFLLQIHWTINLVEIFFILTIWSKSSGYSSFEKDLSFFPKYLSISGSFLYFKIRYAIVH